MLATKFKDNPNFVFACNVRNCLKSAQLTGLIQHYGDLSQEEPKRNTFMPFGQGPHLCPGNDLAITEALFMIHHLVTRYRLVGCLVRGWFIRTELDIKRRQ